MTATILQRFYRLARENPDQKALGFFQNQRFHPIPWWLYKSKVKHFALGLLHLGAQPDQYLYLFPGQNPQRCFVELGAYTLGLQTLSLPPQLTSTQILELCHQFPPSFVFLSEEETRFNPLFEKYGKSILSVLLSQEGALNIQVDKTFSFRQVFNLGIQQENRYFSDYRKLRDASPLKQISPICIDLEGQVHLTPLCHGEVIDLCKRLDSEYPENGDKALFFSGELWKHLERCLGLFWPIFKGCAVWMGSDPLPLGPLLRQSKPSMAYVHPKSLEAFMNSLLEYSPGWIANYQIRSAIRHYWGKNFQSLMTPGPIPEIWNEFLKYGGIKSFNLMEKLRS